MIRRNLEVDGARDPTDDPTPKQKHKTPEITIELPDTPGEYFVEATVTSLDDPDAFTPEDTNLVKLIFFSMAVFFLIFFTFILFITTM